MLTYLLACFTLFLYSSASLFAQNPVTVTGTVVDKKSNEPLIGTTILEKGTTNGTITDIDGNFSIHTKSGATLVISSIGYKSIEKPAQAGHLSIAMEEDSKQLDEVVVVGYGVQKKVNLTGSVASVGDGKLENRSAPNLSTMLTGLASGVSVRQSSGNPGDDGANIRVRGIGTFSGSDRAPLVLIDGSVGDMNSVNAEDVESVSVLKDAASAAIYGARGANGVILVTTKKGKKGSAPRVTYSGQFTQTAASRVFDFISNYADYMELYNRAELVNNPTIANTYKQTEIDAWRAAQKDPNGIYKDPDTQNEIPNWLAYPNTNWSKVLFAPSFSQKHNLSVSGGSENSNYLLSLNYYDNPGTLENTGLSRFNFRVNAESKIGKYIKAGTQTYAVRQKKDPGNLNQVNTYRFQAVGGMTPIYNGMYGGPENPGEKSDVRNPLKDVNAIGGVDKTTTLNTTWYAEINHLKGLTARASVNYLANFYDNSHYTRRLDSWSFRKGEINAPATTLGDATTERVSNRTEQTTANVIL
ncbi:MAG: SusC/RagA family TonB-linked outer membrane protein, partial [Mediterranea sp.]|nr:SusC/RagA family TonB-linked outer membrane protein [Mediterranea sp.]